MSGLADDLKLLVELPNIHAGLMFCFRLNNGLVDQVSILANEDLLEIFMLITQMCLP